MAKNTKVFRPAKDIYLTPDGVKETQKELKFLKSVKRLEVTDRIQKALEFGDLAENSEYDAALDEQSLVENKITYLDNVLRNAKIIDEAIGQDIISIGSTVTVNLDGKVDKFTIVGRDEVNPSKKYISNESPLGRSILGTKVGQTVQVKAPNKDYVCKIIKIS